MENCNGCLPLKELQLENEAQNIEHETTIQGINNRMQNLEEKFDELKKDVNDKIDGIPDMLENALNKLLAKVAKWLLIGIGIIFLIIVFAFTRPVISKGLSELQDKINKVEIIK